MRQYGKSWHYAGDLLKDSREKDNGNKTVTKVRSDNKSNSISPFGNS
jgi:hypothetical protein